MMVKMIEMMMIVKREEDNDDNVTSPQLSLAGGWSYNKMLSAY